MRSTPAKKSQKKRPPNSELHRILAAAKERRVTAAKKLLSDPKLDPNSSAAHGLRKQAGVPDKPRSTSAQATPTKPLASVPALTGDPKTPAQKYAHYRSLKGNARFEYFAEHKADIWKASAAEAETRTPGRLPHPKLSPCRVGIESAAGAAPGGARPPQSVPDGFKLTRTDHANLEKFEKWQTLEGSERRAFFSKHVNEIWSARDLIRRANQ